MRISVAQATQLLNAGQVVALPTETVYGLAASIKDPQAIANIFTLKGRPTNNPLIVHLADATSVKDYVTTLPPGAEALMESFWPGPLTLILPINEPSIPTSARAGLPTAAFRLPRHPLTREVLRTCGPLVMPSANLSGRPSATRPEHVEQDFGAVFPILDGGPCQRGLESTIVIFRQEHWEIVRLGALDSESLGSVLGYLPRVVANQKGETPVCPGQLYRHYAPRAKLQLAQTIPSDVTGIILGYVERQYPVNATVWTLGALYDPESIGESLYACLRRLDEENVASAYVDGDIPVGGLWDTIRERLHKAASRT
jgi:L-threonylcarbamoyladenylate synthase